MSQFNRADVRKRFILPTTELDRIVQGSGLLSAAPLDRVLHQGERYGALTVGRLNAGGRLVLATLPDGSERWLLRSQYDQIARTRRQNTSPATAVRAVKPTPKPATAAQPKASGARMNSNQIGRLARLESLIAAEGNDPVNRKRAANLLREAATLLGQGPENDDKVFGLLKKALAELQPKEEDEREGTKPSVTRNPLDPDKGSTRRYTDARAKQRQRMGLAASREPAIKVEATKLTFSVHALAQQQVGRARA